jgi:hypothetical protein
MLIIVSQIIPIMITYFDVKYSNELLVYVFCRIYRPRIVKNFVSYFTTNHNNFTTSEAWFLGVSYVTVQFIGFVYIENFYLRLETFGVKMRFNIFDLQKSIKIKLVPTWRYNDWQDYYFDYKRCKRIRYLRFISYHHVV